MLLARRKGDSYFVLRLGSRLTYRAAAMPRILRGQVAGHAYHVLNRGSSGAAVFHKDTDYAAFLDLLGAAKARHPVQITASA